MYKSPPPTSLVTEIDHFSHHIIAKDGMLKKEGVQVNYICYICNLLESEIRIDTDNRIYTLHYLSTPPIL